ncbi:hypothetical protein H5410_041147 [Solanum commersonii]|uniref:Reverse transcriptase domain-containing protein n=1 Tax=Solanum commersonii TaxID=4109 RepID=A0A9J5XR03_SOLCO|nr:hypothetical protein H5410_041147 [Solanum commersonii]
MSRALNAPFEDPQYVGYGLPKWSANINYLAFAYDTIIFTSSNGYSLEKIMSILQDYEKKSGQRINKNKNYYYLHQNGPKYGSTCWKIGNFWKNICGGNLEAAPLLYDKIIGLIWVLYIYMHPMCTLVIL